MIDHVSIAVRDLKTAARFYEPLLATLGLTRLRDGPASIGYGKKHPEFWLNERKNLSAFGADNDAQNGAHVALRVCEAAAVDAFYAAALAGGGTSDGTPGFRPEYNASYYAAFIRDPDGNRIEAVTFIAAK
jgi:catechol 2,3-dioxygenase-like lactoylglutathione lyase family enzyme